MNKLILPEHLLLLAMLDEKGAVVPSSTLALPYGLNGALLLELTLRQRVRIEKDILHEVSDAPTGDDILDEALQSLEACERDKNAGYWVARPDALVKNLKTRLIDRLVRRGILKREAREILWVVPYERFPELDGSAERDVRRRLRDVVLYGATADEPTALLIGLVHACGLVEEVFPGEDVEKVKAVVKSFSEGSEIAEAVSENVASATIPEVCSSVVASITTILDTP